MKVRRIFLTDIILFLIFFFSVLIDSLNGYMQLSLGIYTPIGVLYRGIICLLVLKYVNIDTPFIFFKKIYVLTFVIYLLMLSFWDAYNEVNGMGQNLVFLLKFFFYFALICFFLHIQNKVGHERIVRVFINSSTFICILNIFCAFTGIGLQTYRMAKFGYKVFYVDGNSIGIYLVMSLGIAIWYALVYKNLWAWLKTIIITAGTLIVASRAAIGGTFIVWLAIVLYIVFFNERCLNISKFKRISLGIGVVGMLCAALVVVLKALEDSSAFILNRFTVESASSPREKLLYAWDDIMEKYQGWELLFGKGTVAVRKSLGFILGGESRSIEADFHEVILCFGWGLGCLILFCLLYPFFRSVYYWFKKRTLLNFVILFTFIMWLGHAYMAGHCFTDVVQAPLLAILFVLNSNSDFYKQTR